MNPPDLREEFDRLLVDEPPLRLDLAPVVAGGRGLRRRRRLARGAGVASLAVLAAGIAVPVTGWPAHRDRTAGTLSAGPPASAGRSAPGAAPPTASPDGLTAGQRRIARAIVASSPAGWTFDLSPDRWDGLGVEATADDGRGPGRLLVGVSTATQLLHPCADAEFRQGASCTERSLPGGAVLSLRGEVAAGAVRYVDVTLTHPDGSGVLAESVNTTLTWPLPERVTAQQKRHLQRVSRPDPTYTVEQLARLVTAVDAAARP